MTEVLIFYARKIMVMGNSKNLRVSKLAILLKWRKSRKFDAHEIYMFYSMYFLDRGVYAPYATSMATLLKHMLPLHA